MNNELYGAAGDRELKKLKEFFKTVLSEFGADDPVILRPSPDARQERVIDVLNAASSAKIKNLTFS
jgi:biopolymer transport protein ExbD